MVTSISGVRNENVPGDEDLTVNGTIRETFDFRGAAEVQSFVGGYLVRLSSPTARFASITQAFTVTQTPFAQTVTGVVTNGAFAAVALLANDQDGEPAAGTYADASGNYSLKAPVGQYQVVAFKAGAVAGTPQEVTLNTNGSVVANLFVIPGGPTLSGRLSDASSGAGLPAVQVDIGDTNGAFALAFTDSAGNYSAAVTPGSWRVYAEGDGLAVLGYVKPFSMSQTNYNTTTGSVANINFTYSKANALVFGFLRDTQSNGIARVEIHASDSSRESSTTTATNGYFAFGVAASSNVGVMPDEGDLRNLGFFGVSTNVSVGTNQAVQVNLFVRPVTAYLSGRVYDSGGAPLARMALAVQPSPVGPGNATFYPFTDDNGYFNVGLNAGAWNVALECVEAGNRNLVSFSKDFNVVDFVNQSNISLSALFSTRTISTQVRQTNNAAISNLRAFAGATINGTNYVAPCAITDGSGNTTLKVVDGTWQVSLDNSALNAMGFASATNQFVNLAGANGNATFIVPRFSEVRPNFAHPTFGGGLINMGVTGASGAVYRLETSTNLLTWTTVSTHTAFGGSFGVSLPMAADRFRYYRIILGP